MNKVLIGSLVFAITFKIANAEIPPQPIITFRDKNPNKITTRDLDILRGFDTSLNSLVEKKHTRLDIKRIYTFILNNRAIIIDYNRVRGYAKAEIGSRTRRSVLDDDIDTTLLDELGNSREYYAVAVGATYPIWDKKTDKDINNKKLLENAKLIDLISLYSTSKTNIKLFESELELLRLKQIRDKAQVKTGMEYITARITTLEQIHDTHLKLDLEYIKLDKLYLKLLNNTTDKEGLKRLL